MKTIEQTETWPDPWYPIQDEQLTSHLKQELDKEIGPNHALYGITASVIARRDDRDDILLRLEGHEFGVAEVHLTWSGKKEVDQRWPRTALYPSMDDWRTKRTDV